MINLALDVGDVLCNCYIDDFICKLSEVAKIDNSNAYNFCKGMQKFQDLGLVSLKDKLQLDFPYLSKSNIDELIFAWDNVLVPNTYVLDKISQLNCNFALLSNVGLEHAEFIKNTLGNYPCLKNSEMHLSCYVGARKPTKLFFQSFLFDKPNQHWYFMDDINNNVNMAAKVGFTAFQFDLKSPSWKNDFDKIFDLLKG